MPETIYKKVESIIFGLFSSDDIKKMAAVKLVTPELYDKEGYPVDGGLMDIRLGVIDHGLRCKTCGAKLKECTGHFGHIELARPVIHIQFVRYIHDILKSFCSECNRVLISEENKNEAKDNKEIKKKIKEAKKCPHCKAKVRQLKI